MPFGYDVAPHMAVGLGAYTWIREHGDGWGYRPCEGIERFALPLCSLSRGVVWGTWVGMMI